MSAATPTFLGQELWAKQLAMMAAEGKGPGEATLHVAIVATDALELTPAQVREAATLVRPITRGSTVVLGDGELPDDLFGTSPRLDVAVTWLEHAP